MPTLAQEESGAEAILGALTAGIALTAGHPTVCFANPGTSEMGIVAAMDGCEGLDAVLW
jgi:hypothetical protein